MNSRLQEAKSDRYASSVRRQLKSCREKIVAPTQLVKEAKLAAAAPSQGDSTPSFLMGQPLSLDYNKVRSSIDNLKGNEDEVAALLDALWWRMAQSTRHHFLGS